MKGVIKQATVRRTPTGKYFVSILCDSGEANKTKAAVKEKATVGLDLGIKSFLVASNGQEFANPKHLRPALSRLKYIPRKCSIHKSKRTRHRLALLHEKITNKPKDFLQKTSTRLIRENQSLAIEDLNIKGMVRNHKLTQAIMDCSWGMFVTMLKYKAEWYGRNILQIDRFEASSKTCSNCGVVNKELTLQDRQWDCKSCGSLSDRDVNAAVNIKNFALKNHLSAEHRLKNRNELPTPVGVMTFEAAIL